VFIDQVGENVVPPSNPFQVVPEFRHLYVVTCSRGNSAIAAVGERELRNRGM